MCQEQEPLKNFLDRHFGGLNNLAPVDRVFGSVGETKEEMSCWLPKGMWLFGFDQETKRPYAEFVDLPKTLSNHA